MLKTWGILIVLKHFVFCQSYVNILILLISEHKAPEEPEINVKKTEFKKKTKPRRGVR